MGRNWTLAEVWSINELAVKVKDSANQLWLASLGAYSITQAERDPTQRAGQDGEWYRRGHARWLMRRSPT